MISVCVFVFVNDYNGSDSNSARDSDANSACNRQNRIVLIIINTEKQKHLNKYNTLAQ